MPSTPPEEPLRVGLLGLGYIGTTVGEEFHHHDGTTVASVCDVSPEAREEGGDRFSVSESARYETDERMFDEAALDAVLVGTPHTLHYEQVVMALERGLHVLCDKPLTTDLEQARDLHRRARDGEQVLMVGYQRHLNPEFATARERWTDTDPRWMTAEVTQNWMQRHEGTWRTDPSLSGGGFLYDTGSHLLDAVLWTTGLTPTSVSASMTFVDDEERVDERASLTVDFAEGATADVSTFGAAPRVREHFHAWDDDGAVYLEGREWDPRQLKVVDAEGTEHDPYVDYRTQRTKADAFVEAVEEGTEPPATTLDGLRVTAVTEAAYESARTGGRVNIDPSDVRLD